MSIPQLYGQPTSGQNEQEDRSLFDYLTDIPKGIINGIAGSATSILSLGDSALELAGIDLVEDDAWDWRPFNTKTMVGGLTSGITQFASVFIPVGAAASGLGNLARLGKFGKTASALTTKVDQMGTIGRYISTTAAKGAVTDFVAFQESEDRLSNMLSDMGIGGPLTSYLSASEDDGFVEGRLKNAIEGFALGGLVDGAIYGAARALKKVRGARTGEVPVEEAARAAEEAQDLAQAAQAEQLGVSVNGVDNDVTNAVLSMLADSAGGKMDDAVAAMSDLLGNADTRAALVAASAAKESVLSADTEEAFLRGAFDAVKPVLDEVSPGRESPSSEMFAAYVRGEDVPDDMVPVLEDARRLTQKLFRPIAGTSREVEAGVGAVEGFNRLYGADRIRTEAVTKLEVNGQSVINPETGTDIKAEFDAAASPEAKKAYASEKVEGILKEVDEIELRTGETRLEIMSSLPSRLNFEKMDVDETTETLLRVVETVAREDGQLDEVLKVQRQAWVKQQATELSMTPKAVVEAIDRANLSMKDIAPQSLYLRKLVLGGVKHMHKTLEAFQRGDVSREELEKVVEFVSAMNKKHLTFANRVGKALKGLDNSAEPIPFDGKAFMRVMDKVTSGRAGNMTAEKFGEMLNHAINSGNPAMVNKQISRLIKLEQKGRKWLDIYTEFWMASLLSGTRTQLANIISTAANTALMPVERIVGGAATAIATGDTAVLRSGTDLLMSYMGMSMDLFRGIGISDATQATAAQRRGIQMRGSIKRAFDTEQSVLDPMQSKLDNLEYGAIPGKLGRMARLPFRGLTTMDELFKQVNYRAAVREEAKREARTLGIRPGPDMERFITDFVEKSFDAMGSAARDEFDNLVRPEALQLAREATFTQELIDGTFAHKLQQFAHHPGVRLILPFVRTPTNIVGKATRMTPGLQLASKRFRTNMISPDPFIRAQAAGEALMGAAFWAIGIGAATSGLITGNGPKNPDERAALMATGWRPLSIKTADGRYISYARLEPVAMLLGMASDLADLLPQVGQKEADEIATGFMAALAMNLTNKTYVTGIREVIEVMNDPENRMKRFIQNRIGSHVPSFVAQLNDDPYMRELRGYLDGIRDRLPGSDLLPPRRDILGKPMTPTPGFQDWSTPGRLLSKALPIATSTTVDDAVRQEIASLRFGFSKPVPKVRGVDLRDFVHEAGQDAYDRYQQLAGEVGGVKLHEALERLVKSEGYQRLPYPSSEGDADNPRVAAIQNVIRRYRSVALSQLLRERPEIREAIRQQKVASLTGNPLAPVQ